MLCSLLFSSNLVALAPVVPRTHVSYLFNPSLFVASFGPNFNIASFTCPLLPAHLSPVSRLLLKGSLRAPTSQSFPFCPRGSPRQQVDDLGRQRVEIGCGDEPGLCHFPIRGHRPPSFFSPLLRFMVVIFLADLRSYLLMNRGISFTTQLCGKRLAGVRAVGPPATARDGLRGGRV